jgi:hypothetical protein
MTTIVYHVGEHDGGYNTLAKAFILEPEHTALRDAIILPQRPFPDDVNLCPLPGQFLLCLDRAGID